jgi:hypothetical protein
MEQNNERKFHQRRKKENRALANTEKTGVKIRVEPNNRKPHRRTFRGTQMNSKAKIALMLGLSSAAALVIIAVLVVNGIFVNPKSGFNTVGNFIETIISSVVFSGASLTGAIEYMKLKTGLKQPLTPHSKAWHYHKHYKNNNLSYLPPPPEDYTAEAPKVVEVEKHPYVTIDGVEPEEPTSFFHTKKFYLSGVIFAVLAGLIMYFLVFT